MIRKSPIVLCTDFGNTDHFVGVLKGVCQSILPGVSIIDLTHEIPPGDIRRAAILLWQAKPYFPLGTIFCSVVDPGVGTTRRGMIAQSGGYTFVGPDNGIFTFVLGEDIRAWELQNPDLRLQKVGSTFHGRDIFAPSAAFSAKGIPGSEFGPPIDNPCRLPEPRLLLSATGTIEGEILFADHFGNLLTSLGSFQHIDKEKYKFVPWIRQHPAIEESEFDLSKYALRMPSGVEIPWVPTFAESERNSLSYLVGSSGLLEIIANRQSAIELSGLKSGDVIKLTSKGAYHGQISHPGWLPTNR